MGKTTKRLKGMSGTAITVAAGGALVIGGLIAIKKAFTPKEEGGWGVPGLQTLLPSAASDLAKFIPDIMKGSAGGNKSTPPGAKDNTTPPGTPTGKGTPGVTPPPGTTGGNNNTSVGVPQVGDILGNIVTGMGITGLGYVAYKGIASKSGRAAISSVGTKTADGIMRIFGKTSPTEPTAQRTADSSVYRPVTEKGSLVRNPTGESIFSEVVKGDKLAGYRWQDASGIVREGAINTGNKPVYNSWMESEAWGGGKGKLGPVNAAGRPSFTAPGLTLLGFLPMVLQAILGQQDYNRGIRSNLFGISQLYPSDPTARYNDYGDVVGRNNPATQSPALVGSYGLEKFGYNYVDNVDLQGWSASPAPAPAGLSVDMAGWAAAPAGAIYPQEGGGGGGGVTQGEPGQSIVGMDPNGNFIWG